MKEKLSSKISLKPLHTYTLVLTKKIIFLKSKPQKVLQTVKTLERVSRKTKKKTLSEKYKKGQIQILYLIPFNMKLKGKKCSKVQKEKENWKTDS